MSGKRRPAGTLAESDEDRQEPSRSRKRRSPKRDLDPLLAEIAVIVRRLRTSKRMTTREVADKAEVEVQTIFGAEAGLQNLTLTTFAKLYGMPTTQARQRAAELLESDWHETASALVALAHAVRSGKALYAGRFTLPEALAAVSAR